MKPIQLDQKALLGFKILPAINAATTHNPIGAKVGDKASSTLLGAKIGGGKPPAKALLGAKIGFVKEV